MKFELLLEHLRLQAPASEERAASQAGRDRVTNRLQSVRDAVVVIYPLPICSVVSWFLSLTVAWSALKLLLIQINHVASHLRIVGEGLPGEWMVVVANAEKA